MDEYRQTWRYSCNILKLERDVNPTRPSPNGSKAIEATLHSIPATNQDISVRDLFNVAFQIEPRALALRANSAHAPRILPIWLPSAPNTTQENGVQCLDLHYCTKDRTEEIMSIPWDDLAEEDGYVKPDYEGGALDEQETFWRDHQEWLQDRGYMLRPRYMPNWVPSWKDKPDVYWLLCEDGQRRTVGHCFDPST